MRADVACSVCLVALMTSVSFADSQTEPRPIQLQGFYELNKATETWRVSDGSPWYLMKNTSWANPRVLKQGYVPVLHDSKQYYCMIDRRPKIGSRLPTAEPTFACGEPLEVEWLVDNNYSLSRLLPPSEQAAGFYYVGP